MQSIFVCLFLFLTENFLELLNTSVLAATVGEEHQYTFFLKKHSNKFFMIIVLLEHTCQSVLSLQIAKILLHSNLSEEYIAFFNLAFSLFAIYVTMLIKALAISNPNKISNFCGAIFYRPFKILMPLGFLMELSSSFVVTKNPLDSKIFKKNVYDLVNSERKFLYEIEDLQIVKRILSMDQTDIYQIMTHRSEFIFITENQTCSEIHKKILELRSSNNLIKNFVVFQDYNNILGLLNTFDFLIEFVNNKDFNWNLLIKSPQFVFKNTKLQKVFNIMDDSKCFFVVDEEGDLEGLVTQGDINRSILGNEENEFLEQRKDGIVVSGNYNIRNFNEKFDLDLEEDNITIGGFLANIAQKIPAEGEIIYWENFCFKILKSQKKRIDLILITARELQLP